MSNINEFEQMAITRDLARRPEIRHLAKVLQKLGPTETVEADPPAPIYLQQAYRLIEKPLLAELLITTLEICKK